jgi:hypothetical protein
VTKQIAHAWPDRERASDFDQPFVHMRERIRGPFERAFVADKGKQTFGDFGIVAALAAGEKMRRKPATTLSITDIDSKSWLVDNVRATPARGI